MHRGPSNLQMLHHHPFESYGPVMDNVPGYGILPPGQQPSTSSAVPNYPAPPHPYNQPPPHQHPIPGHSGRDRERERDRERDRERERERERDRQFAADPTLPHPSNFAPPKSISPVHVNANGVLKATNGWMTGPGIIPADERITTGKESRREREREEARANREEREREREREQREREGMDRERNHQLHLMQQQQRQQQPGGSVPPQQHHPHHHHHHVVHHHHPMPPPLPPSYNHNHPGYPSHGNLSPRRVARDLEHGRPRSNPPLSTEVIDLSSSSGSNKRSMVNVSPVPPSGRDQREREREREQREREREREIHEQNSRMPPMGHTRPSSRNAPSIGPGITEHPRLPPLSSANVDRDRERERERDRDRDRERERDRERMMTPFVIPPSQATQAHFSTTPDVVPKAVREARDVRERREPGPGLPAPEELMI